MGFTDSTIRIVVAVLIVGLYMGDQISGMTATVLLIVSGVFLVTSALRFCPMYLPFGFSTRSEDKKP